MNNFPYHGPGGPGGFGPGGPGGHFHREYDDFGHWASGANSNGPWGHWTYHEKFRGVKRSTQKSVLKGFIITLFVLFGLGSVLGTICFIGAVIQQYLL